MMSLMTGAHSMGYHPGGWRHPDSWSNPTMNLEQVIETAKTAERGKLDMRLDVLPQRMIIVGGGYIAAEFAHVFSALGVEIVIVNRGPQLLRRLDDDIATHEYDQICEWLLSV